MTNSLISPGLVFLMVLNMVAITYVYAQRPIALHPENPHYFIYKDKPTIIIGSGEHYGAVVNLDFDYKVYLDQVQADGLNITRTFTGAYVEPANAFNISNNTLAPKPERFIAPWKRSNEQGYAGGGNKFDLTQWDPAYFERLKDFVSSAGKKGVFVELALFCPFYEDAMWNVSPMNAANNVNDVGKMQRTEVYTLDKSGGLLKIQEELVRKIVAELNEFDNVVFEICNEPYFGGVTMEWQHYIAGVIKEAEDKLPNKHLITQNIANGSKLIEDPHPVVSVFNFHYAWPPTAVALNYHLNKAIGDNETGFRGNSDSTYRFEGWRFILAGGSLYNNLDYSFAPGFEKGAYKYDTTQPGGGSASLRAQLRYLKQFIEAFDYINMKPDSTLIRPGTLGNVEARILAEHGKQYAGYLYGTTQQPFKMMLPAGSYELQWLNTITGQYHGKRSLNATNAPVVITPPQYTHDIAFKITRKRL